MRFQTTQRPPPHLDRRLQWRMLGYVAVIAVLLFGWQAWTSMKQPPKRDRERPTEFEQAGFDVAEDAPAVADDDELRIGPRRSRRTNAAVEREDAAQETPEVNVDLPRTWLAAVEDDTVGIRHDEADAFYRVLAAAQTAPLGELRAQAISEASLANLKTAPAKYRGRPIAIAGELRTLRLIELPKNDSGFSQLFEAWINTPQTGDTPYRVVCSEIPAGMQPQERCRVSVETTGYFFKREGYETQDRRLHLTATVLAGRLLLADSRSAAGSQENVAPWMMGVSTVIGLALLATVIGYAVGDSRARRSRRTDPLSQREVDDMSHAGQSRMSIAESLRRLEDAPLFEAADPATVHGNGHAANDETVDAEELIDLPTPFPPTRVPKRWS